MVDWDRIRRKRNPFVPWLYALSSLLASGAILGAFYAVTHQTEFGLKVLVVAKGCAIGSILLGVFGRILRSLD